MNQKYLFLFMVLGAIYLIFLISLGNMAESVQSVSKNSNINEGSNHRKSSFRPIAESQIANETTYTPEPEPPANPTPEVRGDIVSIDYEVFGKVQGVYFRKYTEEKAGELGLKGWVMNTRLGTVKGVIQGPLDLINQMKVWLCEEGSPSSHIEGCEFSNERTISKYEFSNFSRRKTS
mmetsp:Transcript_48073/g.55571  ORF Transcript_48073/g.55571 Transcript_48073/m.55571 type:complete len:177 (-) Transcript_48073:35-565(-)